ncbi:MAG: hypothetical protein LBE31_09915 [Deltaproteobacteria bacterium]|jgi:hypothetical protein|nr:hypothetical protein [Deltaproteobacteria bacterium]
MVANKPVLPWAAGQEADMSILSYKKPQSENSLEASDSSLVNINQEEISVRKVLENVMTLWVDALVSSDFTAFHQNLASSWRNSDTPAGLKESFSVLVPYKESLTLFPTRGKLVLLESRPFNDSPPAGEILIRDNLGPESPWQVRGEWRVNKTALGFTLVLSLEDGIWRTSGLRVEIYP